MKKYGNKEYLTKFVELNEADLETMTRNEVFDELLKYEGYGMYAGFTIRNMVKAIYGIDLTHYEEYLDPQSVAEMDDLEEY